MTVKCIIIVCGLHFKFMLPSQSAIQKKQLDYWKVHRITAYNIYISQSLYLWFLALWPFNSVVQDYFWWNFIFPWNASILHLGWAKMCVIIFIDKFYWCIAHTHTHTHFKCDTNEKNKPNVAIGQTLRFVCWTAWWLNWIIH